MIDDDEHHSERPVAADRSRAFDEVLREAVRRRGLSLRALQQRLRDRGHAVSVAALSLWQSGARRPGTDSSADVVRELEDLLGLDEDELARTLGVRRRVPEDRSVPFASFLGLEVNEVTDQSAGRELIERSSTLMSYIDGDGQLTRNIMRDLWQARVDGAREVTSFITVEPEETAPPALRAVAGCELSAVAVDADQRVMRMTISVNAPLRKGDLVLTEWESYEHSYVEGAMSTQVGVAALRRGTEVGVHVYFSPELLPSRCRVTVQRDGEEKTFPVPLLGGCASHVEFDFGPGTILLDWDW